MLLPDNYTQYMSKRSLESFMNNEPIVHLLTGGKAWVDHKEIPIMEYFDSKCDCVVKKRCNLILPILICNN